MTAIGDITGFDRKTVWKYLLHSEVEPRYSSRPGKLSLLDPFLRRGAAGSRGFECGRVEARTAGAQLQRRIIDR